MTDKDRALERVRKTIGDSMEELRARVFKPEIREEYKLTFVARHPESSELDLVVTEDEKGELLALLARRVS